MRHLFLSTGTSDRSSALEESLTFTLPPLLPCYSIWKQQDYHSDPRPDVRTRARESLLVLFETIEHLKASIQAGWKSHFGIEQLQRRYFPVHIAKLVQLFKLQLVSRLVQDHPEKAEGYRFHITQRYVTRENRQLNAVQYLLLVLQSLSSSCLCCFSIVSSTFFLVFSSNFKTYS